MDILRLLDQANLIQDYEIQDFRRWSGGMYYKLKIVFIDESILFAREYIDESERNYAFHWQDKNERFITRWDNAPHHHNIVTFPHHKHNQENQVVDSIEITIKEVIDIIQMEIAHY